MAVVSQGVVVANQPPTSGGFAQNGNKKPSALAEGFLLFNQAFCSPWFSGCVGLSCVAGASSCVGALSSCTTDSSLTSTAGLGAWGVRERFFFLCFLMCILFYMLIAAAMDGVQGYGL